MSRLMKLVFILLITAGFFLIYLVIPDGDEPSKLGSVNNFSMDSVHGESYTMDNDKLKFVTFYYTNCPDICPMTMVYVGELEETLREQGLLGTEVELISITIDPAYDTPEVIREYAQSFMGESNSGWYWLRGSEEQTRDVANNFKMVYQKSEDRFIAHSTTMYLVDENFHIRGIYDMATRNNPVDTDRIMEDIDKLVK